MGNKQDLELKRREALALLKEWEYQLEKDNEQNESQSSSNPIHARNRVMLNEEK